MTKDIIVIGGGASGLMCALTCALKGKRVTILEGGLKVGKKILVSGNGRCNLTNKNITNQNYNQFCELLNKFDNEKTLQLFESLGLQTYFDDEGRCYPLSNHSASVLDVILNKLNQTKCEILVNTKVESIEKTNTGYLLTTNQGEFEAKKVVVATGGNTMQDALVDLGLEFKPFKPSLCGLKTLQDTKLISGVRTDCEIKVVNKDFVQFEKGEVIFKDEGISGICIFNLSAKLNWAKLDSCSLSLNLLPNLKYNQLVELLQQRKNNLLGLTVKQFFDGMLHKNLCLEILNRCHMNLQTPIAKLTLSNLKNFATHLQNLTFNVCGFENNNQVYNGGVCLTELNENLESKKHKNLYFCGEVVNVDGECGGYNLQWAWTSGHVVGDSLWLN